MFHSDWYQFYKEQRSKAKAHNAATIAKNFNVKTKTVSDVIKNEGWAAKYKAEIEKEQAKKNEAIQHLKDLDSFKKEGLTIGELAEIAIDGAKLVKRFQSILSNRIAAIEEDEIPNDIPEIDEGGKVKSIITTKEDYIFATSQMLVQQTGALGRTIATIHKTRAIVSESLDVQETIILLKQLELDLGV